MKLLKTVFAVSIFFCSFGYAQTKNIKETMLLKTFKFIIEQQNTLENIKSNFPEISIEANIANLEFNKSYSKVLNNIYIEVKKEIEVDFEVYVTQITDHHTSLLNKEVMTRKDAIFFIKKVKNRAKGALPSQHLKVFKTYEKIEDNFLTYKN